MNYALVRQILGKILLATSLLMVPPIFVALYYGEGWTGVYPFLLPIGICIAASFALSSKRSKNQDFFMREGFVIVGATWILFSFIGCLPFVLSGSIPSIVDAFFEASSGFTTTGASVLSQPELLSHSQLFWRSFTHLIGGMGVLVFVLAIMPRISSDSVFIMKAEVPGPTFGKLHARIRSTARILYGIYFVMTAILIVLLIAGRMPVFDSFIHAFGTAGTGGFGIKSNSVAYYQSPYLQYVLGVGMLVFGVNFNLYYALMCRQFRHVFQSEELRWYLGFVVAAVASILINTRHLYTSFSTQLREVFFTVSSIITTTGYTNCNYDKWPLFSIIVLLVLMFIGGMAGSTAGGLKVSRSAIYIKSSIITFRKNLSPNRKLPLRFERKVIGNDLKMMLYEYLTIYCLVFISLLAIVSISAPDFPTAFSAVAATFNNIGPGTQAVGPTGSYAGLSVLSKIALSIGMIMGRLEILPIIVLFAPRTWRRT
ncbi:MAG: TrkH family potassium uptake protein [Clostridiaceae bacterium]|jgi:trk system potassium uptake protein TrkH|nr:TrkH family potassium uptake protein [Clostridiaceae bacterium]